MCFASIPFCLVVVVSPLPRCYLIDSPFSICVCALMDFIVKKKKKVHTIFFFFNATEMSNRFICMDLKIYFLCAVAQTMLNVCLIPEI